VVLLPLIATAFRFQIYFFKRGMFSFWNCSELEEECADKKRLANATMKVLSFTDNRIKQQTTELCLEIHL